MLIIVYEKVEAGKFILGLINTLVNIVYLVEAFF